MHFVNILQISSYFTDKLLGIVRDTIVHMKGMTKTENDQNISSGLPQFADKIHKGDAALEFIKHVCAVLALDQNVQHDVLVILFQLIQALYYVDHMQPQICYDASERLSSMFNIFAFANKSSK